MNEQMYTFAEAAERCFLPPEKMREFLTVLGISVEEDGNGNPLPVSAGQLYSYQERIVALKQIMKSIDDLAFPIMGHERLRWQKSREQFDE